MTRAALGGAAVWAIYAVAFFFHFYIGGILVNASRVVVTGLQAQIAATHLVVYAVAGAVATALLWVLLRAVARHRVEAPIDRSATFGTASLLLTLLLSLGLFSTGTANDRIAAVIFAILLGAVVARGVGWARMTGVTAIGDPWAVCFIATGIPWTWSRMNAPSLAMKIAVAVAGVAAWVAVSYLLGRTIERHRLLAGWTALGRRTVVVGTAVACLSTVVVARQWLRAHDQVRLPDTRQVPAAAMPNVVLIVMDAVSAKHVSFHGYERDTTPFLREMAREATVFSRAVASSNMTLPTHASLLTGQYARRHGAHYAPPEFPKGRPVAAASDTLAEQLAAKGYRTGAIVANQWYLDRAWGMAQGFEAYDDRHYLGLNSPANAALLGTALARLVPPVIPLDTWRDFRRGDDVTRAAARLLDDFVNAQAPFFLFLNYMDAHHPYLPPAPFDTRYPGRADVLSLFDYDRIAGEVMRRGREITDVERAALVSQYDGAIAYIDRQVAAVAGRLAALGQLDNTLFIVTSDHGEAFGEHHLVGHGLSTTLEQTAVPLLVKFPGPQTGKVVRSWASHVDIVPTVLAAARLPADPAVDGVDLATLTNESSRAVVSEAFQSPYFAEVGAELGQPETAVFFGDHKLVIRIAGDQQLFDLAADPGESRNLHSADDAVTMALDAELGAWLARVPRFDARGSRPDKDTLDRLKSLGYVR